MVNSRKPSRKRAETTAGPQPVIGLEAEFSVYVDDARQLPEHVFGKPCSLVRGQTIPRLGRSVHLPSGGALYFDTGVIELATPIIELEPRCAERAARCLWEQIAYIRKELDAWEADHDQCIRLEGFSAHYNVSVPGLSTREEHQLALLLTYLLHPPLMLLAANRMSSGVGVRPRRGRIEVTVDFTPDEELMTSTAAFIAAVVPAVAAWKNYELGELTRRRFPIIAGFQPRPHTSRKGFLARFDGFPRNPFVTDPNEAVWRVQDGRTLSLRRIAQEIAWPFRPSIRQTAGRLSAHHVLAVLHGRARSLLDFVERTPDYVDVGRHPAPLRMRKRGARRSRYERVIHRLLTHRPIQVGAFQYEAERMLGWYQVRMRNLTTGRRRVFTLDELADVAGV